MTDFLSIEDVLTLHADQVDLYGGQQGIRDRGSAAQGYDLPRFADAGFPGRSRRLY